LKLDNLGQLITKYPQLKKCSVDMLECLDFTRIDNNFNFSPYILVDAQKLVKKFVSMTKKNPIKCMFGGEEIVFGSNSMTLVIVDNYNKQSYQVSNTDYPNVLNNMIYYISEMDYVEGEIKDCIITLELYNQVKEWVDNVQIICGSK
jgi:hypothetical protein